MYADYEPSKLKLMRLVPCPSCLYSNHYKGSYNITGPKHGPKNEPKTFMLPETKTYNHSCLIVSGKDEAVASLGCLCTACVHD